MHICSLPSFNNFPSALLLPLSGANSLRTLDQLVFWAFLNLDVKLNCSAQPTAPRTGQRQHSASNSQFM